MKTPITRTSINIIPGFLLLSLNLAQADFAPIPLTQESFNQDLVVEKTASPPLLPVTTATMDGGLSNTNFTWYERGFRPDWPTTGLPTAGSINTSEAAGDHEYLFAPTYKENNAMVIDSGLPMGSFKVLNPSVYGVLSFLVSGGNGGGALGYTLHHQDGSTQTGSFVCRDWLTSATTQAYTAGGRVNVTTYTFELNNNTPKLFAVDVALTNNFSPLVSIDFNYTTGSGREVVFAVSGGQFAGDPVRPIPVTGYNADVVVEASSTRPEPLSGYTTATMDDGIANAGNTWYEQGYYSPAPDTGLPPAGSQITSAMAPDHQFLLAPSYAGNNVVLLDALHPQATLLPQIAGKYSALSFLTSAGHGPVTNKCIVSYKDGSSETNLLISPDWFDPAPMAYCPNGRVKVGRRLVDHINSDSPKLFAVDFKLANTSSPITNLSMTFIGGSQTAHAAVFAVSGADNSIVPPAQRPTLALAAGAGGTYILTSTRAGRLQSTTQLNGSDTVWTDEGVISTTCSIVPSSSQRAKFYRVVSQ